MGINYKVKEDSQGNILPWKCPICKQKTIKCPALSRRDNKSNICPECGVREAMEDFAKFKDESKNVILSGTKNNKFEVNQDEIDTREPDWML